ISSKEIGKDVLNVESSKEVGKKLAEKVKEAGLNTVVFDRNGYPYHGRVKAFAEGVREGGIKF
ncbi:MAG: 50S ribosomal protein L18, partial [Cyclobacteriaceae bacterium]